MDEPRTTSGRFSGSLDDLVDILRFFCLAQLSQTIKVESNESVGLIQVRGGQICHAETDNVRGEAAFYAILRWKEGNFESMPLQATETQSIEKTWEPLISEAMNLRESKVKRTAGEDDPDSREPLFQRVQKMNVTERIRYALTGDKEARAVLVRDANRVVQVAVVSNPRISESEIAGFANSRNIDEEVLRRIGHSREWTKAYPVRLALVRNPKTPLAISVRLVQTLLTQDLKQLAKSKSVPSAVVHAARRLVAGKG
jgi:hypothetical protein